MESFIRLAKAERRSENRLSACFICLAVLPLYFLALVVFFSLLLHFDVVAAQVPSCFSFLWLWTLASSRSTPVTPNKSNNSECRSPQRNSRLGGAENTSLAKRMQLQG
jgi:hypothetical protein